MTLSLESQLESILFFKGEPMSFSELAKLLDISTDSIKTSIDLLQKQLEGRGVQLVTNDDEVTLSTHKDMHDFFEQLIKTELTKDLSKAALETLAIIIYKGPLTRSEVDYIRGVNSQFIIRTLLIRGLVTRVENPKDERSFLYRSSIELLQMLGIQKQEDMPEYENIKTEVESFITTKEENNNENKNTDQE